MGGLKGIYTQRGLDKEFWSYIFEIESSENIKTYIGNRKLVLYSSFSSLESDSAVLGLKILLNRAGVSYSIMSLSEIENANGITVLFSSEQEYSGAKLYFENDTLKRNSYITYSQFFGDFKMFLYKRQIYLLNESGVKVVPLLMRYTWDNYCIGFRENTKKKAEAGLRPPVEWERLFFGELYSPEYADEMLFHQRVAISNKNGTVQNKDMHREYFNVSDGMRLTDAQPEKYDRTIWFFGACYIFGMHVEDKNTIPSFFQRRCNAEGYSIRVCNKGKMGNFSFPVAIDDVWNTPIKEGDIVVIGTNHEFYEGLPGINVIDIYEQENIPYDWMWANFMHINHKAAEVISNGIFERIKDILALKTSSLKSERKEIKMKSGIEIYMDRYFHEWKKDKTMRTGAIVMNCNPFTLGHLYLIETAYNQVDRLIIFVVEENRSDFSFQERFVMVNKGVAHLENVIVVPSGDFILSKATFPEYFGKKLDMDLEENTENDVRFFAETVSKRLGIDVRFVGEEPDDIVTAKYNSAMKSILPAYNIELIEIPRKKCGNMYISATKVRERIENYEEKAVKDFLPVSTSELLFGK